MDEWKDELMNFTSNQKKHERGLSHFSHVWIIATLWTIACEVPLSTGFSRQEYWSELPFPSPGVLPDPGIKLTSAVLQADSLPLSHQGLPIPQRLMQIRLSLPCVPSPAPTTRPTLRSVLLTYLPFRARVPELSPEWPFHFCLGSFWSARFTFFPEQVESEKPCN